MTERRQTLAANQGPTFCRCGGRVTSDASLGLDARSRNYHSDTLYLALERLRTGDPARVKFDALSFQRHGTIDGTVRVITENSFQLEKSASTPAKETDALPAFFRARIALGPRTLRDVPDIGLIPGMSASAEIIVGKRRIISYVLDPMIR